MNLSEAADLLKNALQRPVAYHRAFAEIAGKVSAGLMLSQAWYWTPRTNKEDGWFYKTRAEWQEETAMSRTEQETARKRLLKLGLIEEKLAGMPAKMHFRVNSERLISLLVENPPTRVRKSRQAVGGKPANMKAEKPPTITESTAETTTKITRETGAVAQPKAETPSGILLLRDVAGAYPSKTEWPRYLEILGENPDETKLRKCRAEWVDRGYNKVSWKWFTEWYVSGMPERNGNGSAKGARTYEWMGRMYALDEVISDDGQRYTVMGPDGTPTRRWHNLESLAADKGITLEQAKHGMNT